MTVEESVVLLPDRPSPHFTWDEFACHDAIQTPYPIDPSWRVLRGVPLANELERIRRRIGPFTPTSVFRTEAYHRGIYAAMHQPAPMGSQHLTGRAADVPWVQSELAPTWNAFVAHVKGAALERDSLIRYAKAYRKQKFVHIDIRQNPVLQWEDA